MDKNAYAQHDIIEVLLLLRSRSRYTELSMNRTVTHHGFDLKKHLAEEHKRSPLSEYLREIVYGGNDGIVTTFAVVAGFAGAQANVATSSLPFLAVLLFGSANLLADGLSMSMGSFLAIRAEQDLYRNEHGHELQEIRTNPDAEYAETLAILQSKGFAEKDAITIADTMRKNESYWTEFMMKDELELPNPEHEKPFAIALSTFIAFVTFGFIPLIPFIVSRSSESFPASVLATAIALLLLGMLRAFVTQKRMLRGIFETLLVGGSAAGAAYFVGTFFRL